MVGLRQAVISALESSGQLNPLPPKNHSSVCLFHQLGEHLASQPRIEEKINKLTDEILDDLETCGVFDALVESVAVKGGSRPSHKSFPSESAPIFAFMAPAPRRPLHLHFFAGAFKVDCCSRPILQSCASHAYNPSFRKWLDSACRSSLSPHSSLVSVFCRLRRRRFSRSHFA
eukprot:GABV01009864.1.p1 GENE.GABV01009864.1~~GABV01009864.1.p1  ORF type:complete len:192 (-),score=36.95 GABV01009864.1:6-524(-)